MRDSPSVDLHVKCVPNHSTLQLTKSESSNLIPIHHKTISITKRVWPRSKEIPILLL